MNKAPFGQVRIISGSWRGSKLPVETYPGLRPTSDRVRETLFNWLQSHVGGRRVLDCFAGTGALGFEAASRGAAEVLLLDAAAPAAGPQKAPSVSSSANSGLPARYTQISAMGSGVLMQTSCLPFCRARTAARIRWRQSWR
mgnify:CR=1 FL=1